MTELEKYLEENRGSDEGDLDDVEQELVADGGRESYGVQDSVLKYGSSAKQGAKSLKEFCFWNAGTIGGALLAGFGAYELAVSGRSEGAGVAATGLTLMAAEQAVKTTY